MLGAGQRGRSSRGSHAPPGSRVMPWQGEGPQPIPGSRQADAAGTRLDRGRAYEPMNNVSAEMTELPFLGEWNRGIAGGAERCLSGLGRASWRPLLEKEVWRHDS